MFLRALSRKYTRDAYIGSVAERLITTFRSPNDVFQSVGSAYAPCDFEVNSVIENEASFPEVTDFHLYKKFVIFFPEHFG